MNPTMSRADREAFLAGTHVGVLAVAEAGRGPLAVPVWYRYAPGDVVRITIPRGSRKTPLLRAAGRASLCVQTETVPYQYVSVEGPVEVLDAEVEGDQREMAIRYLGDKLGGRYLTATAADRRNDVLVLRVRSGGGRSTSRDCRSAERFPAARPIDIDRGARRPGG